MILIYTSAITHAGRSHLNLPDTAVVTEQSDDLFAEITIDAVLLAARGMREGERNRVPVSDERMRMVL